MEMINLACGDIGLNLLTRMHDNHVAASFRYKLIVNKNTSNPQTKMKSINTLEFPHNLCLLNNHSKYHNIPVPASSCCVKSPNTGTQQIIIDYFCKILHCVLLLPDGRDTLP